MDKKLLLGQMALEVHEVHIDGYPEPFKVKGLNGEELQEAVGDKQISHKEISTRIVAKALVDPVLTRDEVAQWKKAAPAGHFLKVYKKIAELSGIDDDADKSGV